ncbi:MAG: Bug family tripartite tricarboxylate transporter substrate binding protein [Candidatus Binatia bacterium]
MNSLIRKVMLCVSVTALTVFGILFGASTTLAAKPYYQGRTLTLMVDFSAGGPTDIECRLYARHLKNHLAGKPTLVVMNRPGAGGTLAMNWLYERARRDGRVVGCQTASGRYTEWYVGDPKKVGLRANMEEIIPVMFTPVVTVGVAKKNIPPGINKPEDILKAKKFVVGGFRADSSKDLKFRAIFDLVGAKYKYVTGYHGSADLLAAFMRDEIDYVDGSTPFYLNRVKPLSVDKGTGIPLWYHSRKEIPSIRPGLPAPDFVKKLTGKEPSGPLWKLFNVMSTYRQILFPPGVPKEAVDAIRSAFRAMGRDPKFLADYRKIVGIEPTFMTEQKDIQGAIKPWKTAGEEIRQFRLKYIEEGRKLAGKR